MSEQQKTALLQIRITPKLAANLKQLADQEANTTSAVVRRLLTKGLSRELHDATRDDDQKR